MLKRLEAARRQGLLSDLDVHFAQCIAESGNSPPVLLAAALLCQLSSSGHVCLDLDALAEQPVLDGSTSAPPLHVWQEALHEHPACGTASDYTPLVLDGKRLYLRRYYDYECAVAAAWLQQGDALATVDQSQLDQLFPVPATGEDKQRDQRAAARAALQQHRVLISGGPGTGKTTTLASILGLLLLQQSQAVARADDLDVAPPPSRGRGWGEGVGEGVPPSPPAPLPQGERGAKLKILLAAPTGKAAARMQDAIRGAKARLPLSDDIKAAMPEEAQTLHRLLGARPQGGGTVWRHHADNPLDCDVLVVDEASMIDLAMMARLTAALPPHARLILLGDKDQLASVDAGAVFADLCSAGAAMLGVSFRFDSASGIGQLAQALRLGDADKTIGLLRATTDELYWVSKPNRHALVTQAAQYYARFIAQVRHIPGGDVFAAFSAFRLLTPLRQGPLGVTALNQAVEQALVSMGEVPARSHWYVGKPVMVMANDYALRLFNGDIGICVHDEISGELRVSFPADEGMRLIAPARLPAHETAWAMTVHKSQGSEFDQVALVLPEDGAELITRELVYTAVTRARQSVFVWASEASLRAVCVRRIVRHSGLVERLAAPSSIENLEST